MIPMQLKAIQHAVLIGDECHPQARVKIKGSISSIASIFLFEIMFSILIFFNVL